MSEEVKELLDKLGSMEDAPLIWINQRVENLITESKQLKDRINKAVEYIEKHRQVYDIDGSVEPKLDDFDILASPKYLISLLKGDKE